MMSSSSEALVEELAKARDEVRQAKSDLAESANRVAVLELQCAQLPTVEQTRVFEDHMEVLSEKSMRTDVDMSYPVSPSSPDRESPKTQSDDEYIVVEQEAPEDLQNKLQEKEVEIRNAIAHAKKLEEMYNTAEQNTCDRQVKVIEANLFEKFDDANALLEKVKELEELLTAGQIQIYSVFVQECFTFCLCKTSGLYLKHHRNILQKIAALEEKSKRNDEAQKKVEYEKVLFLETEDQLVKNFKKAHDEAEQYRSMIFQLETSVKVAEEKAVNLEKCMEAASLNNQELESEISDLNSQLQRVNRELSSYESNLRKSNSKLIELERTLSMYRDKADSLEQELEMYRAREKKIEDDLRSIEEKTVVHEATSSHLIDALHMLPGESMDGHAPSIDRELDMLHGRSDRSDDEMKFVGENVVAHVKQSKLLMKEFTKLQTAHILYTCEAEASKSQLQEHVKDLEAKASQLEQEIMTSREKEDMMKREVKVLEERAAFYEGLKLSYADYTCNLEKKNDFLEQELIVIREEMAVRTSEQQKLTLDRDRLRDVESQNVLLEAQIIDLQTKLEASSVCELCPHLKTQIRDLEGMLGELSLELQDSRRREQNIQKEIKSLEEVSAAHEQLASRLKDEASSLVVDHNVRMQALQSQIAELQEQNMQMKTSNEKQRLWAEEAASVLREHAGSLHGLREACSDVEQRVPSATSPGKEGMEILQEEVEGLHLAFRDAQLCDGSEVLQLCKKLLSLERNSLNFQMLDLVNRNTSLKNAVEELKSRVEDLQKPPEKPALESKKSFLEVSLDGELQSLRAQVTELHSLRARVTQLQRAQASEVPSLQARLEQLMLSLQDAETRKHEQNLELMKVQRKLAAAEKEACTQRKNLLDQAKVTELSHHINDLKQKLTKAESENASLRKEVQLLSQSNPRKVHITDEIVPVCDTQVQKPKQKPRRRRSGKLAMASPQQETEHLAPERAHSPRHLIAVYLLCVVLVALAVRLSFLRRPL
ncbi:uncharacterized protein [Physcomitrium patens]|uniref:Uncharacterized protein n=1 Tax=Physcomitrium patens TaxID=3218 RepID=A0A7I4CJG9_PHYPA|nr:myosin heavy chain, striated muscle-like isoform X2 [Physcomitrium patens]|eukprot:XP_024364713.1 myosin heavy chain, striated muscle-like isoform X2 [Physcomitrella patens]